MPFATWRNPWDRRSTADAHGQQGGHDIVESKGLTRRVKHLEIHNAYIHILQERGVVTILQVQSDENQVDVMTKTFG